MKEEKNTIDINEIVKIEQMPIIFSQLEIVGKQIDEELEIVRKLEATEENKQEVKKIRANINNTLNAFEDRRKFIKNKILEDYNTFNDKYENEVKTKLQNASEELKNKIDDIESEQLKVKTDEVYSFIYEHIASNHLENIINKNDVITCAGLKLNLSTSLKSLKEDAKTFIERVANEVKLIEMEETPSNLLYEYQHNGFDLTKAKLTLIERQKEIEELAKQRERVQEQVKQEEEIKEAVEEAVEQELIAPVEIKTSTLGDIEDKFIVQFTVKGTRTQLRALKEFLENGGYEYD